MFLIKHNFFTLKLLTKCLRNTFLIYICSFHLLIYYIFYKLKKCYKLIINKLSVQSTIMIIFFINLSDNSVSSKKLLMTYFTHSQHIFYFNFKFNHYYYCTRNYYVIIVQINKYSNRKIIIRLQLFNHYYYYNIFKN